MTTRNKIESVFKCPSHGILKSAENSFFNTRLVSVFDPNHHEIKVDIRFDTKLSQDFKTDRVVYAEIKDHDGYEVDRVLGIIRETDNAYSSYTFTSETGYVKFVKILYNDN